MITVVLCGQQVWKSDFSTRFKIDDIVKSPYAALRFILRHCDVHTSTPHSSGFARLASGAFYFVVSIMAFYEFIKIQE